MRIIYRLRKEKNALVNRVKKCIMILSSKEWLEIHYCTKQKKNPPAAIRGVLCDCHAITCVRCLAIYICNKREYCSLHCLRLSRRRLEMSPQRSNLSAHRLEKVVNLIFFCDYNMSFLFTYRLQFVFGRFFEKMYFDAFLFFLQYYTF